MVPIWAVCRGPDPNCRLSMVATVWALLAPHPKASEFAVKFSDVNMC